VTEFGSDRMWGLKELPYPEPISWVPATGAWLLLGVVVLVALLGLGAWRWRSWQRDRYRREALDRVEAMLAQNEVIDELPLVLRSVALSAFPREEVAALRGSEWVAWLNENGGCFDRADAESLASLPYDPQALRDLTPPAAARLLEASRAWVKGHHARI